MTIVNHSSVQVNGGHFLLYGNLYCYGDIQINSQGKLDPLPDPDLIKDFQTSSHTTANGASYKMTSMIGNINIYGLIDGEGRGFKSNRGPGCNSLLQDSSSNVLQGYGATHAGIGYIDMTSEIPPSPKLSYGHYETPVSLGSGSGYYHKPTDLYGRETCGGGGIRLIARSGSVRIEGSINMNGQDGTYAGGASGGSVWIKSWNIDGSGSISANGGTTILSDSTPAGGGGGGYISLWYDRTNNFTGNISVSGKAGGEDGKVFTKQIEPIFEDHFTGSIWNTKWWDYTNQVTINNDVTLSSPQSDYNFPVVDSLFNISGKSIMATLDYIPKGPDTTQYNAAFLLQADEANWVGLARRRTGLFGISSADGIISASGVPFDYTDVTLRLIKNDSTFTFQYYDSTSTPQTLYTDIRPELANKTYSVKMLLDKSLPIDTLRTDYLRLTPLDIFSQYIDMDGTPADQSAVTLNVTTGSSQYYGLDFYVEGNKIKWDSSGLSDFHTPFTMFIIDYITITSYHLTTGGVELSEIPIDPGDVAINVIHGTSQYIGTDFTVGGKRVQWYGTPLGDLLEIGDELRITYYFDPWNVVLFGDIVAWKDIVRFQYGWDLPANNAIEAVFDSFKVFEGVINNAETQEPIIYVDPDFGSDSSEGRQLSPLKNLFVATAWAKRGGTVVLYDGTHNSTAISRKDLTIRGAEGSKPLITTENVQDTTGSDWEINALSFYGCQGIVDNISATSIKNGIVVENGNFDISRTNIFDTTSAIKFIKCDPIISRNKIYNSERALDFTSCRLPYIYSNIIYDSSVAVYAGTTQDMTVSSNTFDNNQIHIVFDSSSSGIVSSNNLTYNTIGLQKSSDSSVGSYHNNYYASATQYSGTPNDTSGDFTANPLYYDRLGHDYHINAGSPDIGTGLLTYDDYLIDYDGASRLHVDVGALQYIDGTHSGDYYVQSSGDDHWNFGGRDDPFRTLDKAMLVADATVHIDGGHYDSFYLNLKSQNIDLNQLYVYTGSIQYFVSYLTLNSIDINAGYVTLPTFVGTEDTSHVALNIIGGSSQKDGVDYNVEYGSLVWRGYVLEDYLDVGDVLRIVFHGPLQRKALNTLILHSHYSDYDQEKAIFASPSGSDSTVLGGDGTNTGGDGSIELPYRTIDMALSQSNQGDNIVAIAGEYPIFSGLDDRILVPAFDRTSVPDKDLKRYYEDFFAPKDFRAYGTTEFDFIPWHFEYSGKSVVSSGGGFLNFTYDGTNSASAISSFDITNDFEVMADLRNAIDPIKFMVSSPDNTAYFIYDNNSQYSSSITTGGKNYICTGSLEGGDTTYETRYITEYITITGNDVRNKYISLSYIPETSDCSNIALNIVGGVPQNYGEDFYVEDYKIKWDGMELEDEIEPGEILRIIYLDRSLSSPVRVVISLEDQRFTIKVFEDVWRTVMKRDMEGSYKGPWKVSFIMDTPSSEISHHCIYGKGFVSKFLAIAESFTNIDFDKSFDIRTERRSVVFYNERF